MRFYEPTLGCEHGLTCGCEPIGCEKMAMVVGDGLRTLVSVGECDGKKSQNANDVYGIRQNHRTTFELCRCICALPTNM